MKLFFRILAFLILPAVLGACSKPEGFVVKMKVDNLRDREVRTRYFNGISVVSGSSTPFDGEVRLLGRTGDKTLLTFSLVDGTHLASLIVGNGDEIEVNVDADFPNEAKISGSADSKKLLEFRSANSHLFDIADPSRLNEAIAGYITQHPNDVVSIALLVNWFSTPGHEERADSLLRIINPEVKSRPLLNNYQNQLAEQLSNDASSNVTPLSFVNSRDSLIRFSPMKSSVSLLAFLDDGSGRSSRRQDLTQLNELYKRYPRRRFNILEFTLAVDSLNWHITLKNDTSAWQRVWSPALMADPRIRKFAVPGVPFFMVVDSTGQQLLRTRSVDLAVKCVDDFFTKH